MRVLPPFFVVLLLAFLQWRSGAAQSAFVVLAASAAYGYIVMAFGRSLLLALGDSPSNACAAYTLGLLGTCLVLYALTAITHGTAVTAFAELGAVVVAAELLNWRRLGGLSYDRKAVIGLALCVAFTAAWTHGPAGAYDVLRARDFLPAWGDYFIHGARIAHFGDAHAAGRGSILFSDYPSTFYHFASYLSAAPLVGMLDEPGLALATSVWMPLGFLAAVTGAYALGERLAGSTGGIAALAAVAIVPDASNYGLRNGFLSVHWQLFAHPGGMYALGAAFLSLAQLDRWSREGSRRALLASALLAAATLVLRAHVFLLFWPAWLATVLYCVLRSSSSRLHPALLLAGGLAVAAALANLLLARLAETEPGLQWRFAGPALGRFLEVAHSGMPPTAYISLYSRLIFGYPWELALAAGIVLAYLAALGAFAAVLPAAVVLASRRSELRPSDAIVPYVLYCWLLLMLFAPLTWAVQGPELIDRPVVLVYGCAAIWSLCLLARLVPPGAPASRLWSASLLASLLALPAIAATADRMIYPKFTSGEPHMALRVEPGLSEAAAFMREHARIGDIFAAAGLNDELAVVDLPTMLCSLSGIPAYLARPHLEMIKDSPRRKEAEARLAALDEIAGQPSPEKAMALLATLGIQWYVVAQPGAPAWDPERKRAAFTDRAVSLYVAPRL